MVWFPATFEGNTADKRTYVHMHMQWAFVECELLASERASETCLEASKWCENPKVMATDNQDSTTRSVVYG